MNDLLWYMTEAMWWSEYGEGNGDYYAFSDGYIYGYGDICGRYYGGGHDEYTALYG